LPSLRELDVGSCLLGDAGVVALALACGGTAAVVGATTTTTTTTTTTAATTAATTTATGEDAPGRAEPPPRGAAAHPLRVLRAPSNGLTDAGARAAAAPLGRSLLEEVHLGQGAVGAAGARALGAMLVAQSPRLRLLCLRGHCLGDEGLNHLARYVGRVGALRTLRMTLRVGDNGASRAAEAALREAARAASCEADCASTHARDLEAFASL